MYSNLTYVLMCIIIRCIDLKVFAFAYLARSNYLTFTDACKTYQLYKQVAIKIQGLTCWLPVQIEYVSSKITGPIEPYSNNAY